MSNEQGFHRYNVGEVEVTVVRDGRLTFPLPDHFVVNASKDQIFQTMGVNPAMMPQQATAPGKKPNQAQIANEQQVDLLCSQWSYGFFEK